MSETAEAAERDGEGEQRLKILYVCHNHPSVRPGGGEAYALEVFRAFRNSDEFDAVFVAKGGPPLSPIGRQHQGAYFAPIANGGAEYFLFTEDYEYDWLFGTTRHSKELQWRHFRDLLVAVQPDIVHFHHTMFFGYDILRVTRDVLPQAPIVYTLHEFMPICHRHGQMVRTVDEKPCLESSPRRCHECFPEISPQTFFMRKRFIQSHLSLVDLFLAPSNFLRDRYVDWGLPAEKILCEEYGRNVEAEPLQEEAREARDRLGFFGQLTPYKGADVLLEAMRLVKRDAKKNHGGQSPVRAWIHGSNLDLQPGEFQNRLRDLFRKTETTVTLVGRYDHAAMPQLMANVDWVVVPSIWWENSPLVIQEAFYYRRPVICSDIGGMAEKVRHGVNGLHFRAGDPQSLAETIRRAIATEGLWERLREGIPDLYSMDKHVSVLSDIYRRLFEEKRNGGGSHGH